MRPRYASLNGLALHSATASSRLFVAPLISWGKNPVHGCRGRSPTPASGLRYVSRGSRSAQNFPKSFSKESRARNERSEEHTSELQSQSNLVCRLLLEKKKKQKKKKINIKKNK